MKIILFSILVIFAIGLYALPQSFAVYPDPDKDPRDYLIRYYAEPDYKDWFDSQFPNTTIEKKVGYPYKIVTSDYYVDDFWNFSFKLPDVAYETSNLTDDIEQFSLLTMYYGGNDEWTSGLVIHYLDRSNEWWWNDPDLDKLDFYSSFPYDAQIAYDQLKITNTSWTNDGEKDIILYEYVVQKTFPDNETIQQDLRGQFFRNNAAIFVLDYPNGDQYQFLLDSPSSSYAKDLIVLENIINTFHIGKIEKFSDMYDDYLDVQKTESITAYEPIVASAPVAQPIVEPEPVAEPESVMCDEGTTYKNGQCVSDSRGGGCLIATAAFGSEMAPQVQFLREIRDNTVMSTQSGTAFMTGFNQFYYSFSPAIADYERENPVFKEAVKVTLTPMLTSLTLLNYVNIDTEEEMLGYGIGLILLNIGMYFVTPAVIIVSLKKRLFL